MAIRASVRFFHSPNDGGGRRYNLVEGFISFVLFVDQDGSLQGGIVDASGNWKGTSTAPGIVAPDVWHVAELLHDGVNHCQIFLDGSRVAASYDIRGAVRSVGNFGISIGAWPDTAGPYTFEGYIGEVRLYKYDPEEEIRRFLDPCCLDRKALGALLGRLMQQDWDATRLQDYVRELLQLQRDFAAAVRGDDPDQTREHQLNLNQAANALLRHDPSDLRSALEYLLGQATQALSEAQLDSFRQRFQEAIKSVPLFSDEMQDFAQAFCLEFLLDPRLRDLTPRRRYSDSPG
jgi:hypothetical protein